jgi:hypothetical protein
LLALYIILRDHNMRVRDEASKVTCWIEMATVHHLVDDKPRIEVSDGVIRIRNGSDYPVLKAAVLMRPMSWNERKRHMAYWSVRDVPEPPLFYGDSAFEYTRQSHRASRALLPGEESECAVLQNASGVPPDVIRYWVKYTDNAGRIWMRDVYTAELLQFKSARARREIRGSRIWGRRELLFRAAIDQAPSVVLRKLISLWEASLNFGARIGSRARRA